MDRADTDAVAEVLVVAGARERTRRIRSPCWEAQAARMNQSAMAEAQAAIYD
jgi:hypothetical protein